MLIDSHCHLDLADFDHDRKQVWQHCQELAIKHLIVPGIQASSWQHLLTICNEYHGLHPALGLHPLFITQHQTSDLDLLTNYLSNHPEIIAIGEIGLDFYLAELDRQQQLQLFIAQLNIAKHARLPVIIHARKSHDLIIQQLRKNKISSGVIHAFNGSMEQAKQYLDLGFKLGFGGTLTYPNARKIHNLAQQLPIEGIVLETDAPDMLIHPLKRQRNSPIYLSKIANQLSKIRNITPNEIAFHTTQNTLNIFQLK